MAGATGSTKRRASAKRISIFNHKGGVGKTTLTYNIAAAMAASGKRVLLVDSDPQCNLTAYVIDSSVVDDLLDNSDGPSGNTIWSALKPVAESIGLLKPISSIPLFAKVQLIAGDIKLSEFENELNNFWGECFQRKRRGFNGTMAISEVVNSVCLSEKIDVVFYDSGPNIGALNRVILLDCDYFIIPAAYDLFSVRALKTLGRTLLTWVTDWRTISDLSPIDEYLLPGGPKFLGYITQNFSVYRGAVASAPAKFAGALDRSIQTDIVRYLKAADLIASSGNHKLGEVKDFGALITASQQQGVPLWSVSGAGTPTQRQDAKTAFKNVADRILQAMI